MSYRIRTADDARRLRSMSSKPQDIEITWGAGASPSKECVAGIIHPNLTSLNAKLRGEEIRDSWAGVLRRSDSNKLKILTVRSYYRVKNIEKAISSLGMSQVIGRTLMKLSFILVHFDEISSMEFNKTLHYFVHLRCLIVSACRFDGPVNEAINRSFLVDNAFWGISHGRPFEELILAVAIDPTCRNLERTRYFIDIRSRFSIGTEKIRILRHIWASIEKCSAARTSSIRFHELLPNFELSTVLRYLCI